MNGFDQLILTMLSLSKRIIVNDIDNLKEFYCLANKPKLSVEEKRVADDLLAKMRERERRERKEKLYSYHPRS